MEENNVNNTITTTTTKGKALGTAGMVIGIVAIVWAIIPVLGAGAWWLAVVGLVLSLVAFFSAKKNNNPKRGGMMAGIILSAVALALSIFWIYKIAQTVGKLGDAFKEGIENLDTAKMRESINNALESVSDTTQSH